MKIERETTLNEAVQAISTLVEQLRGSRISVGDRQVSLDERVTLEVEIESKDDEFEVEFEIKWRAQRESGEGSGERTWE